MLFVFNTIFVIVLIVWLLLINFFLILISLFNSCWNFQGSGKKPANKFEQHMRAYKRKSASAKGQRAVAMSIEGRNMSLWM